MKKKLIAVTLCLLLLGLTPVPALAATVWTDSVSYDAGSPFDGGTGLETDPFIITSETSLAQLAVNVNDATAPLTYSGTYFRLDANLDLSGSYWVPIGSFDLSNPALCSGSFADACGIFSSGKDLKILPSW